MNTINQIGESIQQKQGCEAIASLLQGLACADDTDATQKGCK